MSHIRVSASAAIIRAGQLLLVEFDDESGLHYNLPGGGADPGETLEETVKREVFEETSAEITIGRLLLVREYEPTRLKAKFGTQHKLNLIFECQLVPGSEPRLPDHPDPHQTAVRWWPLGKLLTAPLVSETLPAELLAALNRDEDGIALYCVEA